MDYHNEFIMPGPYRHYKGSIYVVCEVITHMDGPEGTMVPLADPLVVYRDLAPVMRHVNGRHQYAHQRYARPLSDFTATVTHNNEQVNRFTKE